MNLAGSRCFGIVGHVVWRAGLIDTSLRGWYLWVVSKRLSQTAQLRGGGFGKYTGDLTRSWSTMSAI